MSELNNKDIDNIVAVGSILYWYTSHHMSCPLGIECTCGLFKVDNILRNLHHGYDTHSLEPKVIVTAITRGAPYINHLNTCPSRTGGNCMCNVKGMKVIVHIAINKYKKVLED